MAPMALRATLRYGVYKKNPNSYFNYATPNILISDATKK
jgi:hypothetical protein